MTRACLFEMFFQIYEEKYGSQFQQMLFTVRRIVRDIFSRIGETPCGGVFDNAEMEESAKILRHPVSDLFVLRPLLLIIPHLHFQSTRELQNKVSLHNQSE